MVAIAVVAAVGISSFVLMSNNPGEISPVAEKSVVLKEKISVLDSANPFSAPLTIAQSMKAAQPAPNVTIGDDGKIYVLYQDTVDEKTNIFLKTSTDNGKSLSYLFLLSKYFLTLYSTNIVTLIHFVGPNNKLYKC